MPANTVIGVLVLVLILRRQGQVRVVRQDVRWWLLAVVAVYGVVAFSEVVRGHRLGGGVVALLVVGLLAGAGMGVWRGFTVRVWREGGQVLRRGTPLTIALWLVAIAIHVALDIAIVHVSKIHGVDQSTILLYLAVTWGAQGLIVADRAAKLRQVGSRTA